MSVLVRVRLHSLLKQRDPTIKTEKKSLFFAFKLVVYILYQWVALLHTVIQRPSVLFSSAY